MPDLEFVEIPCKLLRDGTGALLAKRNNINHHLPNETGQVDTPMIVEIFVFSGDKPLD